MSFSICCPVPKLLQHLVILISILNVLKYDDEFPKTYFNDVLEFMKIGKKEFIEIVDMHRNEEIWKFENKIWK